MCEMIKSTRAPGPAGWLDWCWNISVIDWTDNHYIRLFTIPQKLTQLRKNMIGQKTNGLIWTKYNLSNEARIECKYENTARMRCCSLAHIMARVISLAQMRYKYINLKYKRATGDLLPTVSFI